MPRKATIKGKKESSSTQANKRLIITSALPYANGPLHLGHMVEYIQTDIFARFQRLIGRDVVYCCADDTHGTPIEVNARKQGITPEQLIAKYFKLHQKDFDEFHISFDSYYSTNTEENKYFSELIFKRLQEKSLVYKNKVNQLYCEHCERFLPDRFVKGHCPKCKAEDQYGDVCEKCGTTYNTTDLAKPFCILCNNKPVLRETEHYFFKLSLLKNDFILYFKQQKFQRETINFLDQWLQKLEDWCISRDGPYFGFKIPGEENKYFYVWLDAPIGYISSYANYVHKDVRRAEQDWNNAEIVHFIGKDITYFHFLFWPAMLASAELKKPDYIHVHGFLTVNKEKMSKSRGTFITARDYLDHLDPEYLRYYFASHLGSSISDINLDLHDFKEKVNNELVANIANLAYRALSFVNKNFNSELTKAGNHFNEEEISSETMKAADRIKEHYSKLEFKDAVKEILYISSLGNKYFQEAKPWETINSDKNSDKKKSQEVLTFTINIVKNLAILIKPILPEFSASLEKQLAVDSLQWNDIGFNIENKKMGKANIVLKKVEDELNDLLVVEEEDFPLLIKVGEILKAEQHPNADRLYVLQVNIGDKTLQLVAGIKSRYQLKELPGKTVAVLCNLQKSVLRGVESQGMVLVVEKEEDSYKLIEPKKSKIGEVIYPSRKMLEVKEIDYKQFSKVEILCENKRLLYQGKALKTDIEEISVDMPDGSKVQ